MAERDEFRGLTVARELDYKGDEEVVIANRNPNSAHVFRIPSACVDGLVALLTLSKAFPGEHRLEVDPRTGKPGALLPASQEND